MLDTNQTLPKKFQNNLEFWTALMALGLYFSGFLVFVTPLPLVFLALKKGVKASLLPALATLLVVTSISYLAAVYLTPYYAQYPSLYWLLPIPSLGFTPDTGALAMTLSGSAYYGVFMLVAITCSRALNSASQIFRVSLLGVIGIFALCAFSVLPFILPRLGSLYLDYRENITMAIDQVITLQEKSGAETSEVLYLRSRVDDIVKYFFYLFPSFVFVSVSTLFSLNLVLAKRFFTPFFTKLQSTKLSLFRVPFQTVWIVIALLAVTLLTFKILDIEILKYAALNLLVILGTVYLFQGFAILMSFLDSFKIFGLLRMTIYFFLVMFLQPAVLILTSLGFFDSWLDLRKIDKSDPTPKATV